MLGKAELAELAVESTRVSTLSGCVVSAAENVSLNSIRYVNLYWSIQASFHACPLSRSSTVSSTVTESHPDHQPPLIPPCSKDFYSVLWCGCNQDCAAKQGHASGQGAFSKLFSGLGSRLQDPHILQCICLDCGSTVSRYPTLSGSLDEGVGLPYTSLWKHRIIKGQELDNIIS